MTRTMTGILASTLLGLAALAQLSAQQTTSRHHHYRLVDLGTFGGPNGSLFGFTVPVNPRGLVTGCSDSSVLDPNFPIQNPYFGGDPYIQVAYEWENGARRRLGVLPGGANACTQWINDHGMIVGASDTGEIDPLTGVEQIRAVLWDVRGAIRDLGTLGGNGSVAWAINNAGQITGNALNKIPDDFNFNMDFGIVGATETHAFLWQNGVMRDLGTLGGPDSGPFAINERGQVVGLSATNSIVNQTTGLPTIDPFFWDGNRMIDLGSLGGTIGLAVDLNDRGQVIGNSSLAGDQISLAFMWPGPDGEMIELPTLGGTHSEAKAINSIGDVAGGSRVVGDAVFHAVLWSKGTVTDLGVVPGDLCAEAMAINSRQQIVGFSNHDPCFSPHAHGFLWENGVLFDLNRLISNPTTLTVVEGVRITERGEIAGNAVTPEGNQHGVLLIPCDEGHLNVEGCDYGPVDDSVAAQTSPVLRPAFSNSAQDSRELRTHRSQLLIRTR